jgi:hypothetical protein
VEAGELNPASREVPGEKVDGMGLFRFGISRNIPQVTVVCPQGTRRAGYALLSSEPLSGLPAQGPHALSAAVPNGCKVMKNLGTSAKTSHLWERPAEPRPFQLQPRDIEILYEVLRHRFLQPGHVHALFGGSAANLAVRLRLLW